MNGATEANPKPKRSRWEGEIVRRYIDVPEAWILQGGPIAEQARLNMRSVSAEMAILLEEALVARGALDPPTPPRRRSQEPAEER